MRGSGSLIVRKVRFLVSPSRLRSGRGVQSSVLPTTAQRHLLSHDRVSAVEDDFLDSLTTFKKIVHTTGMRNEGLNSYLPSSAWMNKVALGRPLAVMNSAPTDINAADFHEFDNQTDAGIGLAPAWNICYHCPSSIPFIHHAGCTQQMYSSFATVRSASFGTVREQVKDEEDEEGIREHEQRSENFRDQGQDIHTSIEKVLTKDTEAGSGFGSVKQNDLYEKELVRKAEETSGNLAWSEAGWTKEEVWNWPNSISMARLLSGPVLAWYVETFRKLRLPSFSNVFDVVCDCG